ncbi:MAG: YceI family protein [Ilumatobacteraceae bacterium]
MSRNKKIAVWVVGVILALVVLVYGGIFVYIKFFNKAEKNFDTGDTKTALNDAASTVPGTVVTTTVPSSDDAGGATTTAGDVPSDGEALTADNIAGTWTINSNSTVGYRVKETLGGVDTEAVGRSSGITGSLTVEGTTVTATELTIDMTTFSSDSSQRDSQFNGRIMQVSKFPTATFKLTSPIDLASIPAEGSTLDVKATGDLTLHGVTKSVTFDLTAQQGSGRIGVNGSTEITFADFGIDNPSNGFAETGDTGTLEFVLVFGRAA